MIDDGQKRTPRRAFKAIARRAENRVERFFVPKDPRPPLIDPYLGYAAPHGIVLRGRVLTSLRRTEPSPTHSRWTNLRQMAALFATHEVADVAVEAGGVSTLSDGEGYFSLTVPDPGGPPGWRDVPARLPAAPESVATLSALVPDPGAVRGVISDIDDTVLQTGAYSLARNLWTTFTGSALTREVFPDSVALIAGLHDGRNPVFYVSSSPWNMHAFLDRIFLRAGLVRGPMFLRDLGVAEGHLIGGHLGHKGHAIDTILAANPDLPFVLMGDTGQHDAEVYFRAAERHPGRVERVFLRAPGPGADETDKAFAERIKEMGIPVEIRPEFEGVEV